MGLHNILVRLRMRIFVLCYQILHNLVYVYTGDPTSRFIRGYCMKFRKPIFADLLLSLAIFGIVFL